MNARMHAYLLLKLHASLYRPLETAQAAVLPPLIHAMPRNSEFGLAFTDDRELCSKRYQSVAISFPGRMHTRMECLLNPRTLIFISDANEVPSNPCQREILVDEAASNGYVVWTFTLNDPDNEKYEMDKRIGLPSAHPKQVLAVSMASVSRSFPFHISGDKYLVKSKVRHLLFLFFT